MSEVINTKMTDRGVVISFNSQADWNLIKTALQEHLQEAAQFYQGSSLYFDLSFRELSSREMQNFINLLEANLLADTDFYFVQQEKTEPEKAESSRKQSKSSTGRERKTRKTRAGEENKHFSPHNDTRLIRRTLRSGQSVEHLHNLVIMGDVNPGAEIKAGGDIVVFGKLRGLVHAGALGDKSASITALELVPTQIRIAGVISRSPDEENRTEIKPERAYIKDDRIVVKEIKL